MSEEEMKALVEMKDMLKHGRLQQENKQLKDRINKAIKELEELYSLYKEEDCYTISDKLENSLIILKEDNKEKVDEI